MNYYSSGFGPSFGVGDDGVGDDNYRRELQAFGGYYGGKGGKGGKGGYYGGGGGGSFGYEVCETICEPSTNHYR